MNETTAPIGGLRSREQGHAEEDDLVVLPLGWRSLQHQGFAAHHASISLAVPLLIPAGHSSFCECWLTGLSSHRRIFLRILLSFLQSNPIQCLLTAWRVQGLVLRSSG